MNHDTFSDSYLTLKDLVKDFPLEPGVYIMRDEEGNVIYVGKAKILRNRVTSYFSGQKDAKTRTLMKHVHTIENIIVPNEYEALLLELTLIKQHYPKYNISLKDGKTYPVVRITRENFPRVFRTRTIIEDGSNYFGPFPNIPAVDALLELVDKLFPLRKCRILHKRKNPCMYFHIGRCKSPCCGKVSQKEYGEQIDRVKAMLSGEGKNEAIKLEFTTLMHEAAAELNFERAVLFRNAIAAMDELYETATVVDFDTESRDYIAWANEGIFSTFTVFSMRGGKMTGRDLFPTRSAADEEDSLATFITSYYNPSFPPPPRIYLSVKNDLSGIKRWFQEQFGYEPELITPDEKRHEAVLMMALQNAQEDIRKRMRERGAGPALDELARVLNLSRRPEKIEGFDISHLDGQHPVASLISFANGIPDRKNYRYFKLKSTIGIVDDYASMREAVHRRYSRLIREGKELPDLILIDGGIGQVNAAQAIIDDLSMDTDIVGLAERDEELWLPAAKEPIKLSKRSEALKVLQHVRDETHRFANTFNKKLRSKDLSFPILESVEGIGPARAAAIMKTYETLEAIAAAEIIDIADRCNISEQIARAVRAAVKLAIEDRDAKKKCMESGKGRSAAKYMPKSDESIASLLAAEATQKYGDGKNEREN
jgi:excinuclease ABC subunit C